MNWIVQICQDQKITRYELGLRANIKHDTLKKIVDRNTKIYDVTMITLLKIAVAIDLDIDKMIVKYADKADPILRELKEIYWNTRNRNLKQVNIDDIK